MISPISSPFPFLEVRARGLKFPSPNHALVFLATSTHLKLSRGPPGVASLKQKMLLSLLSLGKLPGTQEPCQDPGTETKYSISYCITGYRLHLENAPCWLARPGSRFPCCELALEVQRAENCPGTETLSLEQLLEGTWQQVLLPQSSIG